MSRHSPRPSRLSSVLLLTLLLVLLFLTIDAQRNSRGPPPSPAESDTDGPRSTPNSRFLGPKPKRIVRDPPADADEDALKSRDPRGVRGGSKRNAAREVKDPGSVDWIPATPSASAGKPWAFRTGNGETQALGVPSSESDTTDTLAGAVDASDTDAELAPKRPSKPTVDPTLETTDDVTEPPAPSHAAQLRASKEREADVPLDEEDEEFESELSRRRKSPAAPEKVALAPRSTVTRVRPIVAERAEDSAAPAASIDPPARAESTADPAEVDASSDESHVAGVLPPLGAEERRTRPKMGGVLPPKAPEPRRTSPIRRPSPSTPSSPIDDASEANEDTKATTPRPADDLNADAVSTATAVDEEDVAVDEAPAPSNGPSIYDSQKKRKTDPAPRALPSNSPQADATTEIAENLAARPASKGARASRVRPVLAEEESPDAVSEDAVPASTPTAKADVTKDLPATEKPAEDVRAGDADAPVPAPKKAAKLSLLDRLFGPPATAPEDAEPTAAAPVAVVPPAAAHKMPSVEHPSPAPLKLSPAVDPVVESSEDAPPADPPADAPSDKREPSVEPATTPITPTTLPLRTPPPDNPNIPPPPPPPAPRKHSRPKVDAGFPTSTVLTDVNAAALTPDDSSVSILDSSPKRSSLSSPSPLWKRVLYGACGVLFTGVCLAFLGMKCRETLLSYDDDERGGSPLLGRMEAGDGKKDEGRGREKVVAHIIGEVDAEAEYEKSRARLMGKAAGGGGGMVLSKAVPPPPPKKAIGLVSAIESDEDEDDKSEEAGRGGAAGRAKAETEDAGEVEVKQPKKRKSSDDTGWEDWDD